MEAGGSAKRVRIYINEGDLVGHTPTDTAILEFLRRQGAAGATVLRGIQGFGSTGRIHTVRLVDMQQHLPLLIEWIDTPEQVERLLKPIKEMVRGGLITVEDTEIVHCAPHLVRDVPRGLAAQDVMSRHVESVARQVSVRQVVELMLGKAYRAVPVVDGGLPVGIITNTDLVVRGGLGVRMELLRGLGPAEVQQELAKLGGAPKTAEGIMTSPPVTVSAATPLPQVAAVMAQRHLKRLPVVNDHGALVGMVSRLDVLRTVAKGVPARGDGSPQAGLAADAPASTAMHRDVPVVHPESPFAEVVQAVISTRLNRALVVDAELHGLGLITDAELLDRVTPSLRPRALRSLMHRLPFVHAPAAELAAEQHARARTAAGLMVQDVPVVREDAPLKDAVSVMLDGAHKVVAVVDAQDRLVGILDRADILRGLVRETVPSAARP